MELDLKEKRYPVMYQVLSYQTTTKLLFLNYELV